MDISRLIERDRPRFKTATAFVEVVLREAILTGALPGGTALRQEELAAAFEVSRMPVREALRQLEAQALVDFAPHRGAVVTDISAEDAADHYAIRAALEPAALRLSLPHLSAADFERAEALIAEMDAEEDIARLGELNRRFHLTLYAKAGRPRLLALVEQHLAAADRYLRFHFAALGRDHMAQDEHAALLAAARAGDAAGASAILTRHVETAARNIEGFFAARQEILLPSSKIGTDRRCPMAEVQKISVAVTTEQLAALKAAVESGDYATTSEVVREALRDWQRRRDEQLARLRALIAEGEASGPDEDVDFDALRQKARRR